MSSYWYLVGSNGPRLGATFQLIGQIIHIGRVADNDIVLHDPLVSRHHARLDARAGSYVITDLGSVNGTWVNGRRIEGPVALRANDSVAFGKKSIFIFSPRPSLGGEDTWIGRVAVRPRPDSSAGVPASGTAPVAHVQSPPMSGDSVNCAVCGALNRRGAGLCVRCGQPLTISPQRTCPKCHTRHGPGVRLCGRCGQPLVASSSPARRRSRLLGWVARLLSSALGVPSSPA